MAKQVDFIRMQHKVSTVAGEKPTIPPNDDHTTTGGGAWIVTDIYQREIFVNLPDGKAYTRDSTGILEFNVADGVFSGLTASNGTSGLKFTVEVGTFYLEGRFYSHSQTIDEITIGAGDPTNPRFDIIVIDSTNVATVVAGTPAADPVLPALPAKKVLVDVIFVPVNQAAGSANSKPLGASKFFDTQRTVIPVWVTGLVTIKNSYVTNNDILYRCDISNVAGSSFVVDKDTNNFWKEVGSGGGSTSEWQFSVITETNTPPSHVAGNRYLVGAAPTGAWTGETEKIAESDGTNWTFTTPTDGMTLKVDDEDTSGTELVLRHYEGTHPAGSWITHTVAQKDIWDANTIVKADVDNTPIALTVGASTFVGRRSTGSIVAMTPAQSAVELAAEMTLSYILTNGGSTGSNPIIISDNNVIKAANGGVEFNPRIGAVNDTYAISTDAGLLAESFIWGNPTIMQMARGAFGLEVLADQAGSGSSVRGIQIRDNQVNPAVSQDLPMSAIIIGSQDSRIEAGVVNTVILGGNDIVANANGAAYINNLAYYDVANAKRMLIRKPLAGITVDREIYYPDRDGVLSLMGWDEITGTAKTVIVDEGYMANNASLVTFTLPATAAELTRFRIVGKGAGGWKIAQLAGQQILDGSSSTTVGTGGKIDSTDDAAAIELICTVADTKWTVISSEGAYVLT